MVLIHDSHAVFWQHVSILFLFLCDKAMQEEALKLVLLALEDGSALSRKVLVLFVVQRLEPRFPQASKTSIGHVVQLLYRASCFKVKYQNLKLVTEQVQFQGTFLRIDLSPVKCYINCFSTLKWCKLYSVQLMGIYLIFKDPCKRNKWSHIDLTGINSVITSHY